MGGDTEARPFKYRDLGSMATISRFNAIVSFKGMRFSGFFGWMMWAVVHITFLTGFKNRWIALFKWTTTFIGHQRDERTLTIHQLSARLVAQRAGVHLDEQDISKIATELQAAELRNEQGS